MSAVSATEVNETNQVLSTSNTDKLSVGVDEVVNKTYDNKLLSAGIDSGSDDILGDGETTSFADLDKLIKSTPDQLILETDYIFNPDKDGQGIVINKNNYIIDFNGHILDANATQFQGTVFTVTGDNVTIKNLHFKNGFGNVTTETNYVTGLTGAIEWTGDDGVLDNFILEIS